MNNYLVNVALANAIFENERNFLETYYPFVLKSFKDNPISSLKFISDYLKEIFTIELPVHSIKNILSGHANEFDIIKHTRSDWQISLTKNGSKELKETQDNEDQTANKLLGFYSHFQEFSRKELGGNYDLTLIEEQIQKFIIKYLERISIDRRQFARNNDGEEGFERNFMIFLSYLNTQNHTNLQVFDELWKGAVLLERTPKARC